MSDPHLPEFDSDISEFADLSDSGSESGEFEIDSETLSDANERGFEQARATYESLVNTLPLSLLIKDREGFRVFANHAYLRFRGGSLEELLGKRDEDLFPPEIARQFTADDQMVMESGESTQAVEETINAEGNRCWIERIKSPIFDRDRIVIGVQLLFWDVTDRVLAERELKHEQDLLRNLLQHVPDSIYFKDRDSRFLRISDAMAAKFGLSDVREAIGKTDADIFSGEHAKAAREDELRVMETRQALVDRVEKETWHDREDTWCMSTKMPFLDDDGEVVGTFGISRDITELKRYQDDLRQARDAADRANSAKSEFLANMSHEIRTPMNAVIGMSELLAKTELSDEQRDYVHMVRDSADSLLRLLNDILDFSKIEARKLELESIPFSVRDLIERSARGLSMKAAEKGLELACRVAPDVPKRLVGDPGRLRQILINLIGNAIKFTDEGEVVVDVCVAAKTGQDGDQESGSQAVEVGQDAGHAPLPIHFSVRDTGIGIDPEHQSAVLDAFTQADTSTTRRFGGTGLGLAISTQLVALMGGELELRSEVGLGSTFSFTVSLGPAESTDQDPIERLEPLGHLPVLVVDDNPTNRRILDEIFTSWQFDPTLADGGSVALQAIDAADRDGHPFSLAVLDCMMPEMDGFELARQIRQRHSSDELKLIMLSSAARADDIRRCEEIGIAKFMTKPVIQSELLENVLEVMGMGPALPLSSDDEIPECPPLRVLVAEDGIANQHVAVGMLQAAGHHAVVVGDGRETVARWQSEPFDLILMDMHMPVMDGITATKEIRAFEAEGEAHIPIIALTAAAMKEDAEACEEAGMDAFLPKPIRPRMLYELLAEFAPETTVLENASASTAERRISGTSFVLQGSTASGERLSQKLANHESVATDETIDLRAAAGRVPGGLVGVRRLAEVFLPECAALMQTLRDEIPGGNAALVERTAHTLKGSAQLFYAQRVYEEALSIEKLAKSGALAACADHLHALNEQVDLMARALRNFLDITSDS